ncbi:LPXTG cell wall anchor domain-containing protein [Streptomyces sp. NPDC101191]|uniref:LPXTG cell wall anchor domain-containing protein n=1 Tax=Streptomyces sp. NPDC101191 TaxID=3366126 RepID=UPI00382B6227
MKIRRIVATAVAAAVTTPVVLLSAVPAFADTKPGTTQTQDDQPTIEELKLAVAAAQKALDAAKAARAEGSKQLDVAFATLAPGGTHALAVTLTDAMAKAKTAGDAKTAADEKLATAEKALKALPDTATQEERDTAQQAVTEAKTAAEAATAAKTAADTKVDEAADAIDDERVRLSREYNLKYVKPEQEAQNALDAAEKALKEAEEEPDGCKDVEKTLTVRLTGPKQIAAGSSGDFSLRLTNATGATLDAPGAEINLVNAATGDSNLNKWLDLKASVDGSWQDVDEDFAVVDLKPMKAGATADVKLRVTVNAKAPKAFASLLAASGYDNKDGSCGWGGGAAADFTITKASKPGSTGGNGNTTQQGGQSNTPVTNGTSGSTGGTLAKTGAGSSTMPIALAGAAAVALGAGAMVVVRRRKAGADA